MTARDLLDHLGQPHVDLNADVWLVLQRHGTASVCSPLVTVRVVRTARGTEVQLVPEGGVVSFGGRDVP